MTGPRYINGVHVPTVVEGIEMGRITDARDVGMPWRDVAAMLDALRGIYEREGWVWLGDLIARVEGRVP